MRSIRVFAAVLLGMSLVSAAEAQGRYGLRDTCDDAKGWCQWDKDRKPIPPQVKSIASKDGKVVIECRRSLLTFASNFKWAMDGTAESAILRKDYGDVDLDRFHYMVCRIVEKGSGVFIGINGFDTKLGWTTGLTVVDLNDCAEVEKGKRSVRLELDLHENSTTFILDELALVSELTDEEKAALIPKGIVPREEKIKAERYHALEALRERCGAPLFPLAAQEQVVYEDTATHGWVTRLTASWRPDGFGEGGIWSADGACIFFEGQGRGGVPVYHLDTGRVDLAPSAGKLMWSPIEPTKLYYLDSKGKDDVVMVWDRETGQSQTVASFTPKARGGYTEFGMTPRTGRIVVAYRETPYAYVIDPKRPDGQRVEEIELPTRLKGFGFSPDETMIHWANCYTYEGLYKVLATGEVGIAAHFSVGHSAGGKVNTVGDFGRHLKLLIPNGLFTERRPGDKLRIWANYGGDVVTDYGRLTDDSQWIFTNGTDGDVRNQHVMIPTRDPGSILRLARYFSTYYDWGSATYSRPSPDYTKLVFIQDVLDNPDLYMVTTRWPDPPRNLRLAGDTLRWEKPEHSAEIAGYNIYLGDANGRDCRRVNANLVTDTRYALRDVAAGGVWAVAAVEHSGMESAFEEAENEVGRRVFLREAERAKLTPPARIVFDGRCSGYQYVRITPETPEEKFGSIMVEPHDLMNADYAIWIRTRGKGEWKVGFETGAIPDWASTRMGPSVGVDSPEWTWVRAGAIPSSLAVTTQQTDEKRKTDPRPHLRVLLASADLDLSLDSVLVQPADAPAPTGLDPRDVTAPPVPTGLKAEVMPDGRAKLTWEKSPTSDFSHFSVYASPTPGVAPGNRTVIRTLKGTEIVDTGVAPGKTVHYAVVAFDSRLNASEPATVSATVPGAAWTKTCEVEDYLADHLQKVAGPPGVTYVTTKVKGDGWFEIPVDVAEGWYRLWLDYTTPFYQNVPVEMSVDGKNLSKPGGMVLRQHPATLSKKALDATTAHLFSDPLRLSLDEDLFHLSAGRHVLRVSWRYNQPLFDKAHLTNDASFRPKAYDPFVRVVLKGRGWD